MLSDLVIEYIIMSIFLTCLNLYCIKYDNKWIHYILMIGSSFYFGIYNVFLLSPLILINLTLLCLNLYINLNILSKMKQ